MKFHRFCTELTNRNRTQHNANTHGPCRSSYMTDQIPSVFPSVNISMYDAYDIRLSIYWTNVKRYPPSLKNFVTASSYQQYRDRAASIVDLNTELHKWFPTMIRNHVEMLQIPWAIPNEYADGMAFEQITYILTEWLTDRNGLGLSNRIILSFSRVCCFDK